MPGVPRSGADARVTSPSFNRRASGTRREQTPHLRCSIAVDSRQVNEFEGDVGFDRFVSDVTIYENKVESSIVMKKRGDVRVQLLG